MLKFVNDEFRNYLPAISLAILGGSLVITSWRVLRLRMEERPPDTEGSCEYTE